MYTIAAPTFVALLGEHISMSQGWLPHDPEDALNEVVMLMAGFGGHTMVLPTRTSI